jgi:hypothetical protein
MTIPGPVPVVMGLGLAVGSVPCELGKTLLLSDEGTVPFISGVPDGDGATVRELVGTLRRREEGEAFLEQGGCWVPLAPIVWGGTGQCRGESPRHGDGGQGWSR